MAAVKFKAAGLHRIQELLLCTRGRVASVLKLEHYGAVRSGGRELVVFLLREGSLRD